MALLDSHMNAPKKVTAPPSRDDSPVKTLIRLAAEGRYKKAIKLAESLLASTPSNAQVTAQVTAWLAYCLIETGKTERGHALMEQTLHANIRSVRPRISHLRSLISEGSPEVRRVHSVLASRVAHIEQNYVSIDGTSPLARAYAAEYEAARSTAGPVPPLLVFNHLPFTGGTSVQVALAHAYQKAVFYNIKRRSGLICIHKFNALSDKKVGALKYVHLHHPYPLDTRGIPAARITIMRDPVSYFLSGYFKRRNLGKKIIASRDMEIKNGGLPEAVEFARKHGLHDGLARQLAVLHPDFAASFAKRYRPRRSILNALRGSLALLNPHLDYVKYEEDLFYPEATARLSASSLYDLAVDVLDNSFCEPGVIKHLEAGFLASMARLGHVVTPRMPHRGASHRPPRESIDQSVKDRIVELNPVDQKLYDRTLAAFEAKHSELIRAIAATDQAAPSAAS